MKKEYKKPEIKEEKIILNDIVASSSFGGEEPGDTESPFGIFSKKLF